MMKTAVVRNEKIVIEEFERPKLQGKGAVVKVLGCGLCGSDIVKFLHGANGTVLGHEIVGEVVEVDTATEFKAGDRLVMGHHVPCFGCRYCKNENYSMCEHFKATNIVPGGFSEYIFASEEHLKNTAFKLDGSIDEVEASFTEPLGCCVRAINRAELKENSTVLVVGLGSIGLLMGQALKSASHEVFGCDLIEERRELALTLGFDGVFAPHDDSKELTQGIGADAVFMTSGAAKAIPSALKMVRDGGTIVVFSSVKDDFSGYANNEIYYRELKVLGSYSPSPADLKAAFGLLRDKKVCVKNFSTLYNLDGLEAAIQDTLKNAILKAYIKVKS